MGFVFFDLSSRENHDEAVDLEVAYFQTNPSDHETLMVKSYSYTVVNCLWSGNVTNNIMNHDLWLIHGFYMISINKKPQIDQSNDAKGGHDHDPFFLASWRCAIRDLVIQ